MSKRIITKRCSSCKQFKSFSEFNKARNRKDGYQYWCKICQAKISKKYKQSRKKYSQTEKGRNVHRKSSKRYQKTEKGKANQRRYIKRNRHKHNARCFIQAAVKSGKLPRPDTLQCSYGKHPAEQYHHKGYTPKHWLDVIPTCLSCHWKMA